MKIIMDAGGRAEANRKGHRRFQTYRNKIRTT